MLNAVVDQCTSELFSQHCEHWAKALLTILQVLFIVVLYSDLWYSYCYEAYYQDILMWNASISLCA